MLSAIGDSDCESVWEVVKPRPGHAPAVFDSQLRQLRQLADEGLNVRAALNDWYANFCQGAPSTEPQQILATIYYHATSIYLSGIFDYRSQFNGMNGPALTQSQVQSHVDGILTNTRLALLTTNLAGVLFFYPLRVAGARVTCEEEATTIVGMLKEVSERSFVVANAFIDDLNRLWEYKGIR